jgi:glycosyltransferase involved in cell wall biosynthesis
MDSNESMDSMDSMDSIKPTHIINIAIDTVFFQMAYSGITRVWETLFKNLPSNKDNKYYQITILHRDNGNMYKFKPELNINKKFKVLKINEFNYITMNQDVDYLNHICKKENFNVFISTYYTYCTVIPNVLLIHDMIPEVFKLVKNHMWVQKDKAILNASSFITISKTTKQDLIKFYPHIKNDKYPIEIIYNSVSKSNFTYDDSLLKNNKILPKSYIFAMATNNESYKNINLIKSLSTKYGLELSTMLNNHIPIIMLCKTQMPNGFKVEGHILYLSHVSDNILNSLYKNALCFVCPSTYEGFGLPIFEAFAQLVTVIALKIPIFEELGGGGINFIDKGEGKTTNENTVTSLFEKIKLIHKNEGKSIFNRIEFGLKQVAKFTEEIQASRWNEYFMNMHNTLLEPKPFINVILQSYKETNLERLKELEYCIIKNLDNPYINSIHDFGNIIVDTYISGNSTPSSIYDNSQNSDSSDSSNNSDINNRRDSLNNSNNKYISNNKFYDTKYIKVDNPNNKWMTYDMAFQYANDVCTMDFGNVWCIINLDIFLDADSNWNNIKGKLNEGFIYAQSRHEFNITSDGKSFASMDDNFAKMMHSHTQDAWIFKTPIQIPSHINCDFELGFLGCDNAIADRLLKSGYKLINQPITYKIFHYDVAKGKNSSNFMEKHKSESKIQEEKNEKPKNKYPERIGSYLVPNYDQLLGSEKDISFINVINGLGGCSNLESYDFISKIMSDRIIMNNP